MKELRIDYFEYMSYVGLRDHHALSVRGYQCTRAIFLLDKRQEMYFMELTKYFDVESSIDKVVVYDSNDAIANVRRADSMMLLDGGCLLGLDVEADNRLGVDQVDVILVKCNKLGVSMWKRAKASACFGEVKVTDCC